MKDITKMSLEEKIGQMILIDFPGFTLENKVVDYFSKYKWGGIILFKKNIKEFSQTKKLIKDLQGLSEKLTDIPLLVSVDQEGGSICPLTYSRANHPGNLAMAVLNNENTVKAAAKYTARELNDLGFNVSYAPVCDVNTNPLNPIVGVRSFGQDVKKVSKLCGAAVKGLQDNGICACAKHFPGHGDTSFDSHLELAKLDHDIKYMLGVDLKPFKSAINAGVWMIMTSHILFPDLDKKYPATLSKKILNDLLRERMGFEGIIITDSFQMKAIKDNYGFDEAAVRAVKAGSDIVMALGSFQEQIRSYEALLKAVKDGDILEDRIDESVEKILKLKEKLIKTRKKGKLNVKKAKKLYYNIAGKAITLVKNDKNILPVNINKRKTGFIYPDINILGYDFTKYLFKNKNIHKISYNNESIIKNRKDYIKLAKECELLIIVTCKRTRLDGDYKSLFNELNKLNKNTAIASIYNSYHAMDIKNIHTHIVTYSFTPESVDVLIKTLFGKHKPKGKLPHDIPGVAKMKKGLKYK
ncbi:MAG: glycoside hydrolase family 3 protein [Armatimonadota bacterium]